MQKNNRNSRNSEQIKSVQSTPTPSHVTLNKLEVTEEFNGPIPPPQVLAKYNQISDGFAERIIAMAEKEQNHRIETTSYAVKKSLEHGQRGQTYALVISLFTISIAGYLIYSGHDTAGTILGSIDLTALATVFIIGKKGKLTSKNKLTEQ